MLAADRRAGLAQVPVSRETEERLALLVDRLRDWQRVKNLVAPSTLDHVWTRHVADSAQLAALAPEATTWVDLGSGAGFPGLVIAIMLRGRPGAEIHLVESNGRKCAFLREVARATGAPATIHNARVDVVLPVLAAVDVVTARALAPLSLLIGMSRSVLDCGATGLFLSGLQTGAGLSDSETKSYRIERIPSRTDQHAWITRVTRLAGTAAH